MIATITDIQGNDELNQLLTLIVKYGGQVVPETRGNIAPTPLALERIVSARFDDKDDVDGFDIAVNDLGHVIDWN